MRQKRGEVGCLCVSVMLQVRKGSGQQRTGSSQTGNPGPRTGLPNHPLAEGTEQTHGAAHPLQGSESGRLSAAAAPEVGERPPHLCLQSDNVGGCQTSRSCRVETTRVSPGLGYSTFNEFILTRVQRDNTHSRVVLCGRSSP